MCNSWDHVIPNGIVKELYDQYEEREVNGIWNANWDHTGIQSPFSELVIYKDEKAHRGEGKEVMDVESAIEELPDAYASVLLSNNQNFITSYRELYIGGNSFQLVYVSLTDFWRSNCGYTIILYKGRSKVFEGDVWPFTCKAGTCINSPIFAFDYIEVPVARSQYPDGSSENFYIDFNESPGIPEQVVVRDYKHDRRGECIPFSEIISDKEISKCIENNLKSDNKEL